MGYEYEFAQQLSQELDVEMEVIVAKNIANMIELLENGGRFNCLSCSTNIGVSTTCKLYG